MEDYSINAINEVLSINKELKRKWEKERLPYAAFIELTPRCNYSCVHCYLQDFHGAKELSLEKIIEIIDILYDKGVLFLTLSGGEILTRKDFLEIYMYAKKKGFFVELFTNGSLLTPKIIECLAKYPPLLVDISIYGASEATYQKVTGKKGEFEKVISNIKLLKNNNIRVSLKTPIIKELVDDIEGMRSIAAELGVPYATSYEISKAIDGDSKTQIHQLSYEDMLRTEFEESLNRESKIYEEEEYRPTDDMFICNVACGSFVIDYLGNICPCMKFRHRGIRLDAKSFDGIWDSFSCFKKMKAGTNNKCVNCKARYYCDFCPAEREFVLGDMNSTDENICAYATARYSFYRENYSIDQAISLFYKLAGKEDLR